MVSSSYYMHLNEEDQNAYKKILDNIIDIAQKEVTLIKTGGFSHWDLGHLERIIIREMSEIHRYILDGQLFFKYGKRQRMLESTYILTDSLAPLFQTLLGRQICTLQDKINAQQDSTSKD